MTYGTQYRNATSAPCIRVAASVLSVLPILRKLIYHTLFVAVAGICARHPRGASTACQYVNNVMLRSRVSFAISSIQNQVVRMSYFLVGTIS
jgi:hypothetical protein